VSEARLVSVDLAYKRFADIGVCVIERRARGMRAEFVALTAAAGEAPDARRVAEACAVLAESRGAELLSIDGPQAWKHPANPSPHSRTCDRVVRAPAKVGAPGEVKPRPYAAFVEFSIALFDALHELGWPRLASAGSPRRRAAEVFPHFAWKRLGMPPLPAKAKCTLQRLRAAHRELGKRLSIETNRAPGHDELQALVAGIAGLALLEGDTSGYELLGEPPRVVNGVWREGLILAPRAENRASAKPALRDDREEIETGVAEICAGICIRETELQREFGLPGREDGAVHDRPATAGFERFHERAVRRNDRGTRSVLSGRPRDRRSVEGEWQQPQRERKKTRRSSRSHGPCGPS
jgi:hypothetical protein